MGKAVASDYSGPDTLAGFQSFGLIISLASCPFYIT